MVGAFCVGGGYASIPLIQTQVIDVHHWISFSEFMDVVAISQMTPGPIGINAATFVGTKVAGIGGAVAATAGFVTPSKEVESSAESIAVGCSVFNPRFISRIKSTALLLTPLAGSPCQ